MGKQTNHAKAYKSTDRHAKYNTIYTSQRLMYHKVHCDKQNGNLKKINLKIFCKSGPSICEPHAALSDPHCRSVHRL